MMWAAIIQVMAVVAALPLVVVIVRELRRNEAKLKTIEELYTQVAKVPPAETRH